MTITSVPNPWTILTEEDFEYEETRKEFLHPQTEILVQNTENGDVLAIEAGVEHAVRYSVVEFTPIVSPDPHVTEYLHQADSINEAEEQLKGEIRDRMD